MYVLCTLHMYHLSTHDRNLYTFAQSTQCLYICSYFMSHMIFLYMCMCQTLPENNEKETRIIKLINCVSIWVSVSVMTLLLFFSVRENKSPSRKTVECTVKYKVKMSSCQTIYAHFVLFSNCWVNQRCGLFDQLADD